MNLVDFTIEMEVLTKLGENRSVDLQELHTHTHTHTHIHN